MIFFIISFLAGILTVLSPCVLPMIPVIIGSSLGQEDTHIHRKRMTVIGSLMVSIILFTIILKFSTVFLGVPEVFWKYLSAGIIIFYGATLVFPGLWENISFVQKINQRANKTLGIGYQKKSFLGDVLIGSSLGPVFSTCSPTYFIILATVLPASFSLGILYLVAYALGLGFMLYLIALFGDKLTKKLGVISDGRGYFKKSIGILMILVGLAISTGFDKKIEAGLISVGLNPTGIEQKILMLNENKKASTPQKLVPEISTETLISRKGKAPELTGIDDYLNTNNTTLSLSGLRGKVVLVEFWTYSCINCQRVIPYLQSWYETYHDDGLEVIAIHTPEFAFEKDKDNVQKALQKFGITYPVVLDNNYQTWNAYGNQYWPRKYIIDQDGYIVYDHIGEGAYDETEAVIKKLLHSDKNSNVAISVENKDIRTPELYFGFDRNEHVSNTRGKHGLVNNLKTTDSISLGGSWDISAEYAQSVSQRAVLHLPFFAKDAYAVVSSETPTAITVTLSDGTKNNIPVSGYGLVTLLSGTDYDKKIIDVEFPAGVRLYTCTFG